MKWRIVFVLVVILSVVCAEENSVARKRKKYGLFPGYLYKSGILAYIAFIAIKVKIIVAVSIFAFTMAFGMKALAALKYGKNLFGCHHENIVYSHPSGFEHPTDFSSHSFEHEYISGGPVQYSSYPGPPEDSYGPPKMPHSESSYEKYGRNLENDVENDWDDSFKRIMKKIDITEYAFDSMNLNNEECRKRFVCEMDHLSKRNSLLGFGMMFFSDQGLNKYRNDTIYAKNFRECSQLYNNCPT